MSKPAVISYIFASRSRSTKFFACLDNIRAMSNTPDYFVWAKLDTDDLTMNNEAVKERFKYYPELTVKWGISNSKIHAINRSLENLPECDILVIQSDDIVWDVKGFDDEIRAAFKQNFPDFSGSVHFPELHAGERTIIVSILGVKLYKRLGYLYWREYESVFADNEFTEVCRLLHKYVFINKQIFLHLHPIWTKEGWDSQYVNSERSEVYKKDGDLFRQRKSENFGL